MFVHTFFSACAIIIDVTPPNTLYSFLLYPIRNTFSKKDSHKKLSFLLQFFRDAGLCIVWCQADTGRQTQEDRHGDTDTGRRRL